MQDLEEKQRAELAVALGLPVGASGIAIFLTIATTIIKFLKNNPQIIDAIKKLFPKLFPANGEDGPVAQ